MTCSTPRRISRACAGQQQVQALRRRDQDVRRVAGELAAILGRGVAGPAGDRDARRLLPSRWAARRDAGQRRPQVALHVVGQRLERRDVQDPDVAGFGPRAARGWVAGQAVEAPQEGGEGLAAPGRRVDERVAPGRDRGPAPRLRVGRGLEARPEPGADRRREGCERITLRLGLRRLGDRGHGTESIGRATPIEHPCCCAPWPARSRAGAAASRAGGPAASRAGAACGGPPRPGEPAGSAAARGACGGPPRPDPGRCGLSARESGTSRPDPWHVRAVSPRFLHFTTRSLRRAGCQPEIERRNDSHAGWRAESPRRTDRTAVGRADVRESRAPARTRGRIAQAECLTESRPW